MDRLQQRAETKRGTVVGLKDLEYHSRLRFGVLNILQGYEEWGTTAPCMHHIFLALRQERENPMKGLPITSMTGYLLVADGFSP